MHLNNVPIHIGIMSAAVDPPEKETMSVLIAPKMHYVILSL